MPDIHIALVEDDPEIRQLLLVLLNGSPGLSCSLVFEDAESSLEEIISFQPDVVLMDIQLPGMSGIEAVKALTARRPELTILMLTVQMDDDSVFQSLCAGASGYLLKATPPAQLLAAIQEAKAGGSPMSPSIARRVIRSFHQPKVESPLSEREREVLRRLCDGETYRSIAEALFVSSNTVKAHIKNIYRKLHVHTRAEAVRRAIGDGLV
jgi:DNA-binding NarL/FixJ family response regulator